jgi:hypothetical protein
MPVDKRFALVAFGALVVAACDGAPTAPAQPTWAEVAPILRGECGHCHGSTASTTGLGYRLDLYETDVCGDAARAVPGGVLAGDPGTATLIRDDVSLPQDGGRPRMPPAPGPVLYDWERQTLQHWANEPVKGPPPVGNRPPTILVNGMPSVVDGQLGFISLLADPDDDPVIGVVELDGVPRYGMNRSGTFAVSMDMSDRPNGTTRVTAVLCDGWTSTTVDLGPIAIEHPSAPLPQP